MKKLLLMSLVSACVLSAVSVTAEEQLGTFRTRAPFQRQEYTQEYTQDDVAAEIAFGREIAARVLSKYTYLRDPPLQHYLNLVGQTMVRKLNRSELEFRFAVIDSDEINAYSTPGGYVFISSAAIRLMSNEAELAGVIAHELGHINERHIVRELNLRATESGTMNSLAAIIGGASEAANVVFRQTVNKAMEILFQDGYSRRDEIEADRNAVLYCALSGYDPGGLQTFIKKVAVTKGAVAVGKSYPRYDQRLDLIEQQVRDEGLVTSGLYRGEQRFARAVAKLLK